jgi:quinoprotein glucose dehydrogenase
VFDRVTGKPIWPIEEREVPTSDIPGEETSPTQPFPTKPPPFERQGIAEEDLTDFTPELRAEAVKIASEYRIGPLFTPPSLTTAERKGTIINPGWGGGANWTGAAVDPETGIIYIPSTTAPIVPVLTEPSPETSNMRYVRKSIAGVRGPQGLPLVKPPWARVTAIDLNKGEIVWQVAHGATSVKISAHPALQGITLPPLGVGGKGGPLVTRTLLFVPKRGEGEDEDAVGGGASLTAYDKKTGEVVAEIPLPQPARGAPMTFMMKGKQFIVVTINSNPPELIALSVP